MPHHHRTAAYWIDHLGLGRHPEGGWFRETYRAAEEIPEAGLPARFPGARSISTAILFLLEAGDISALHRLKSDEVWHFHDGLSVRVHVITPEGEYREILLGRTPEAGEQLQAVVEAGCWFGAESAGTGGFSLVGCTVAPGFAFSDFEMADRAGLTALFPRHTALIRRLTRGDREPA